MKKIVLLVLALVLTGCASVSSYDLGISQEQWAQYTDNKHEQILKNYQFVQERRSSVQGNQTIDRTTRLEVEISGGKVMLPPYTILQTYEPIKFTIYSGDCTKVVPVYNADNLQASELGVCFKDHVLYLDPSRYDLTKLFGSIQLAYLPLWKRGFTYPDVASSGYLRLTDANITVNLIDAGSNP
jgi:hypothetical protein